MKTHHAALLLITCLLLSSCVTPPWRGDEGLALFDGESLDGWKLFLVDDALAMEDVWRVEDGILICKGEPFGYLETEKSYQDFRLIVEWRWPPGGEPGNSGVFLRIAGEAVGFLPPAIEAQMQHGNAGDVWAFHGAKVTGDPDRVVEVKGHEQLGDFMGVRRITDAEKPAGEWNRYEINLRGETLTLHVNGVLVNTVHGLDVRPGPIGLQSEGAEIHFREVRLVHPWRGQV